MEMIQLTLSPWELSVRGSVIYVGLVLIVRFLLRRDVGTMNMADLLFIVIIADASQNAMSGSYESIGDGAVLIGTLVAWNVALDWLSFHGRAFRRLIEPAALPLIIDGIWIRANLRRAWITTDEVMSKLRTQGIEDIAIVRKACLEPSGELGVIRMHASK
jgi:uncharacterized membrane protein YcaP (DUF421 family)